MRYYVHMLDGQVDSKPMVISENPTESPNTSWGIDQLKKNDMLPCEINFDKETEELDYENPKIYENMVEYVGKPLSDEKRKQLSNIEIEKKRQREYPTIAEKVEALWKYSCYNDQSLLNFLSTRIEDIDKKYPKEI